MTNSRLYRLGAACARHPLRTLSGTLAALALTIVLAVSVGGAFHDEMTAPGTSSDRATTALLAGFPDAAGAETHVVARWPGRVDDAAVARVRTALGGLDGVRTVDARTSPDGHTVALVVRYRAALPDLDATTAVERVTATAQLLRDSGARIGVGGEVPESIQGPNGIAEGLGVLVALVVLLITFGSVLAAGLPLLTAFFGLGAGLSLITVLAATTDVNSVSPTLGSMIGLGVGIDYALFIVARHRAGLLAGVPPKEAAARATATAGRSVVFAGLTVLIGITGLAFSGLPGFASMGIAAGLVVLCTVLVSITLLPAVLAALGTRVRARRAISTRSAWAQRLAGFATRRPVLCLLLSGIALLALAAPAVHMRLGQSDAGSERAGNPTRQAYDLMTAGFGAGANGPLTVVVDRHAVSDADTARLAQTLHAVPGVASVSPVSTSPDGAIAVVEVVPATGPADARTHELVTRLHGVLPGGADVTGPTAAMVDMTEVLGDHLWLVVLAVLAASFVLLVFVLRSLVLAAKAVLANLLSVLAAYGVMTLAFQTSWGAHLIGLPGPVPIAAWAPVVLFAILFGLSMDYEVFLLSAVRERYEETGDPVGSVVTGLACTARIIVSAAAIMVVVALGFAFDPSFLVKIIGVGMAASILIDVTITRLLLVPATMALLGHRNWYLPRWLGGRARPVEPVGEMVAAGPSVRRPAGRRWATVCPAAQTVRVTSRAP